MTEQSTDESLMLAYCHGDAAAFEQLYRRHRNAIYRYLRWQCHQAAVADELFQDVWLNVVRARDRYAATARFTTWLYRIAHNRLIDHYRKQKGLPESYADDCAPDELGDDGGNDPLQLSNRAEQAKHLQECLQRLPEAQRECFLLREESGLSLAEIAEMCECGRETIKSRLRYALNSLRNCLRGRL